MTFDEANKIYRVWRKWYWPINFILESIFLTKKPESFLPYPKEVLEEALNIVAKYYFENGKIKHSKLIQDSIPAIWEYTNDEESFKQASVILAQPEMWEAILIHIAKFQDDWLKWLNEQDDFKLLNNSSN
jgi:hypothetical protein